jgi:cis-3-alkyl-4-acyloxetan-2-one decarboxylase
MTDWSGFRFDEAPSLPDWLADEFPFRRRLFHGGRWAMSFVDQGEGPVVLMQHGNPTWSFLWRKVIRRLADEKVRVIAPDLIGLGLSEKPREIGLHSLRFHALNVSRLVQALDLHDVVIVGQDWGGPILGLMAAWHPDRVTGAVFANTGLAAPRKKRPLSLFHLLSHLPLASTLLFKGANFPLPILHRVQGDPASIGPLERKAYRWPLKHWRDRTAPLALARLVPTGPNHPTSHDLRKVSLWAEAFTGPVRLVWGLRDPILGRALKNMRSLFPEAAVTETQAGHFLQEEVPEALAEAIRSVLKAQGR